MREVSCVTPLTALAIAMSAASSPFFIARGVVRDTVGRSGRRYVGILFPFVVRGVVCVTVDRSGRHYVGRMFSH